PHLPARPGPLRRRRHGGGLCQGPACSARHGGVGAGRPQPDIGLAQGVNTKVKTLLTPDPETDVRSANHAGDSVGWGRAMCGMGTIAAGRAAQGIRSLSVVIAIGMLAGGCSSQLGSAPALLDGAKAPNLAEAMNPPTPDGRSELQKATEYWGKAYAKDPKDAKAAINYAKNLKALGEKQQALVVLQQASIFHGTNRALNAEYGRLALEFDQVSLAQKLLDQADDPANPDWRVISARGTVLAKQGVYRDAITYYQRALALAPNEA